MPLGAAEVVGSADEARRAFESIGGPVVLKSQVLSGGRMKAGAVKFADTADEAAAHYEAILPIVVQGETARSVLVEEKSPIAQEYYVGVTWDGRRKLPVVIDDQIVIRPMMYVALSYDHRIVDGREAVTFLRRIKEFVENPERMLMEV